MTTETLRYYDRVGLLKPAYVNPTTHYRYYSVLQYERLSTIKELRQLGMCVEEIKAYFESRTLENTLSLLKENKRKLDEKIDQLVRLDKAITEKMQFLQSLAETPIDGRVIMKKIPDREFITLNKEVENDVQLAYESMHLERYIDSISPTFATNRYGCIIPREEALARADHYTSQVIILNDKENRSANNNVITIPGGLYLCLYAVAPIWERKESIERLMDYIDKHNHLLKGDILQMAWVDISVTDNPDEVSYEFQAQIEEG